MQTSTLGTLTAPAHGPECSRMSEHDGPTDLALLGGQVRGARYRASSDAGPVAAGAGAR